MCGGRVPLRQFQEAFPPYRFTPTPGPGLEPEWFCAAAHGRHLNGCIPRQRFGGVTPLQLVRRRQDFLGLGLGVIANRLVVDLGGVGITEGIGS